MRQTLAHVYYVCECLSECECINYWYYVESAPGLSQFTLCGGCAGIGNAFPGTAIRRSGDCD